MQRKLLRQCIYERLHQLLKPRSTNLTKACPGELLTKPCKAIDANRKWNAAIRNPSIERIRNILKFLWSRLSCIIKHCPNRRQLRNCICHAPHLAHM